MRQIVNRNISSSSHPTFSFLRKYFFPLLIVVWLITFLFAKYWFASSGSSSLRGSGGPKQTETDLFPPDVTRKEDVSHAIIVAGHAVMKLSELSHASRRDDAWYLLPYQKEQGFPEIITSHVKKGIELLQADPASLLLFSGGQTRRDVGPTSEAASYYYLAQASRMFRPVSLQSRTALEEHARDSFENLLFSICRFHEFTGHYPAKITVIGFDFKDKRFTDLHRRAIGYPLSNFSYIGLRPGHPNFDHGKAVRGELTALESFRKDMYGCSDASLRHKREARNPFQRSSPYALSCPELRPLLNWCGPGLIDPALLPWTG